ncbi:hypothetical protein FH041_11610 [Pseudomonas sp. SWI7]|uniref:hypothetical protein n=1 Tax=Pseudomonas sp. SWI7 TaxID=2587597 RepID=UPI00111E8351|nr:hypothetical protein [Pseudomonas sp. SWI7]QDC05525.1 hypothetical protein FH041_11610 [Pseudomonas sp. SWI7]
MSKLSTTTIHGAPPSWDDAEFNRRLQVRFHAYSNTRECTELISHPLEHEWLKLVAQKVSEGFTIDRLWSISHAQLTHSVPLVKPEAVQIEEKEQLKAVVKAEYVAFLQTQLDSYKAKLAKQLLETAEAKERQKREREEAKRIADAEREADECFGQLKIPDGFPEVKAAEFNLELE